jgi:RecB family exonuclease
MGLRLYYVDSVAPFLDEILETLLFPHLNFKLQDSFRILCPDIPSVQDIETVLLEKPITGQILIGRSILTLEQFFRDLLEIHPAPRPLAASAAASKALRLALKQSGMYQDLDNAIQRQYLTELRRFQYLLRIQRFSDIPTLPIPPLLTRWEKILKDKWGLWTREQVYEEVCGILKSGKAETLRGLQEIFFLGFSQVDGYLTDLVRILNGGFPGITLHLFIPPPDRGMDPQGWLAPLYSALERIAESVTGYQRLPLPTLRDVAYPTPLHEAHALIESFNSAPGPILGFHAHGTAAAYLREFLQESCEPRITHQVSQINPSTVPALILQKALGQRNETDEIYFKQLYSEILPTFVQQRLDLAHRGQQTPLLHLEGAFALLNEKARWESLQEELRPRRDWVGELQEEFRGIVLEQSSPWFSTLPLRSYDRPGLKSVQNVLLFELGEGIYPKKKGFPLLPALASDPLELHESYLKLKAILHLASSSATFSFAEQDMEGRILRPSPLFELFIETPSGQKSALPPLWATGKHSYFAENLRREAKRLHHPGAALDRGDLRSLNLRTLMELSIRDRPLSATYLDDYAKCPWKFFARRHLKLEEDLEWVLEVEPKFKGRLSHGLLEAVYQRLIRDFFAKGKIPTAADTEHALEDSLASCSEEWGRSPEFQQVPERLRREEIQRLLSRVRRFLQMESEALRRADIPLFPTNLEWSFGKHPKPQVHFPLKDGTEVPLAGAVDRIDYNAATGEYLVLDYKASSSDEMARQLRASLSYQLFLYLFAVGQILYPEGKALGALYGDLKQIKKNQGMAMREALKPFGVVKGNNKSFLPPEEFSEFQKRLSDEMEEMLQNILQGAYPLEPKECQGERCPYHEICRYDHQPR